MDIVATLDDSWANSLVDRVMIVGKDRLACLIPPPQHVGVIRAMRWAGDVDRARAGD